LSFVDNDTFFLQQERTFGFAELLGSGKDTANFYNTSEGEDKPNCHSNNEFARIRRKMRNSLQQRPHSKNGAQNLNNDINFL
jgi:hypothetical protein